MWLKFLDAIADFHDRFGDDSWTVIMQFVVIFILFAVVRPTFKKRSALNDETLTVQKNIKEIMEKGRDDHSSQIKLLQIIAQRYVNTHSKSKSEIIWKAVMNEAYMSVVLKVHTILDQYESSESQSNLDRIKLRFTDSFTSIFQRASSKLSKFIIANGEPLSAYIDYTVRDEITNYCSNAVRVNIDRDELIDTITNIWQRLDDHFTKAIMQIDETDYLKAEKEYGADP